jgi:hypothetical protein
MIPKIIPSNYEPLANIGFDQTLARVGHINRLIQELNAGGLGSTGLVYSVCPTCQFTTIQSAINQAVADGAGVASVKAVILVHPGKYTENLVLAPGVVVQSFTVTLQPEQVFIIGQHTYSPTGMIFFDNNAGFVGLTLIDSNPGNTITVGGTGSGIFIVASCFSEKSNTGSVIFANNPTVVVSTFMNVFLGTIADPTIKILDSATFVSQQNQFQGGGVAVEMDVSNPGQGGLLISNFIFCQSAHCVKMGPNVQAQVYYNIITNFQPNSSGLIINGAGGIVTNNTITVPTGTGYTLDGIGSISIGGNVYGDSSSHNPTLTVNPLITDSPKLVLPTSAVGLTSGQLWNNLGVVNIIP